MSIQRQGLPIQNIFVNPFSENVLIYVYSRLVSQKCLIEIHDAVMSTPQPFVKIAHFVFVFPFLKKMTFIEEITMYYF